MSFQSLEREILKISWAFYKRNLPKTFVLMDIFPFCFVYRFVLMDICNPVHDLVYKHDFCQRRIADTDS